MTAVLHTLGRWLQGYDSASVTVTVRFHGDGTITVPVAIRRSVAGRTTTIGVCLDPDDEHGLVSAVLRAADVELGVSE